MYNNAYCYAYSNYIDDQIAPKIKNLVRNFGIER